MIAMSNSNESILKSPEATAIKVNNMTRQDNDGVDHINIDIRARTVLGRLLVSSANTDFIHPILGPFSSIEAFRIFIRTGGKDGDVRYLTGKEAYNYSRDHVRGHCPKNFKDIILEASWHKVDQNPELKKLLLDSELPFDHYYLFAPKNVSKGTPSLPIRPRYSKQVCMGAEELRKLFKDGAAPPVIDYKSLLPEVLGR